MFILGHMGIGARIVRPVAQRLPRVWLLFGTLIPDILDKILFYGLLWSQGLEATRTHVLSGTRTLGHTAILVMTIGIWAALKRSQIFAALALGAATHLLLDNIGDKLQRLEDPSAWRALIFPLGPGFSKYPFDGAEGHAHALLQPFILSCEAIGASLLLWEWWKQKHKSEIVADTRSFRKKLRSLFRSRQS